MPRLSIVLLLVSLLAQPVMSATEKPPPVIATAKAVGNRVHFSAVNRAPSPVVLLITLTDLVNASVSPRAPISVVLQPKESRKVCEAWQAVAGKPWRYKWTYKFLIGQPATHDDSVRYAFPYDSSTPRMLLQGNYGGFTHSEEARYALDFAMPIGTPVLAARAGIVAYVKDGFGPGGVDPSFKGKANEVLILHSDGTIGRYVHLVAGGIKVTEGQSVKAGTLLGLSGNSGYSTRPHLHFEVRVAEMTCTGKTVAIRFANGTPDGIVPQIGVAWPLKLSPRPKE
jgi:murein DD-endopeptidase MepM/ murein hydrolase activator NlpD